MYVLITNPLHMHSSETLEVQMVPGHFGHPLDYSNFLMLIFTTAYTSCPCVNMVLVKVNCSFIADRKESFVH